ncbi:MAG: exodeoxyribonuclease VII large subunit, partial [Proteobacteria bacterium]|nr:exodeoxyribonuclease VII large subunit [Pseudomonadota bacterium]
MQSARSHVAGLEPVPVSRLLEQVKLVLEGTPGLASALVVGEVTSIREVGGHRYFTLKDEEGGLLRCVLFQTQVVRSRIELGRMYVVGGRVSVYPAQGQLQLYVRDVRPMDVGDLQRRYELLKAKLQSEGLFDQSRKLGLPSWPGRIGIATSATGSVIHDLQSVIGRRFPMAEVVLAPCSVQGIEAPNSIVRSLRALCRVGVDVIVVARGGGAPEDLA